jgi:hypothetical protein
LTDNTDTGGAASTSTTTIPLVSKPQQQQQFQQRYHTVLTVGQLLVTLKDIDPLLWRSMFVQSVYKKYTSVRRDKSFQLLLIIRMV